MMDTFTRSYFECLVWTGLYFADETSEGKPVDYRVSVSWDRLPDDVRSQILADCESFQEEAGDLIGDNLEQAGHDFCLSRNGHGAGFWDGGWGEHGDKLHAMTKPYGSQTLVACGDADDPDFDLWS